MELELFQPGGKPITTVWDRYVPIITTGRTTYAYLCDEIAEPNEYSELVHRLHAAYDGDRFEVYFNTPGGSVDSAFYLLEAMSKSKAHIHGNLSGTVASAGTLLTMGCHSISVAPYTHFMIHNYSSGTFGKGHEMKAQLDFTNSELNKAFTDIYGSFLTPQEAQSIIDGRDLWLGRDEVLRRWELRRSVDIVTLLKQV